MEHLQGTLTPLVHAHAGRTQGINADSKTSVAWSYIWVRIKLIINLKSDIRNFAAGYTRRSLPIHSSRVKIV